MHKAKLYALASGSELDQTTVAVNVLKQNISDNVTLQYFDTAILP